MNVTKMTTRQLKREIRRMERVRDARDYIWPCMIAESVRDMRGTIRSMRRGGIKISNANARQRDVLELLPDFVRWSTR